MSGGGESNDQNPRVSWAKRRHRPTPIALAPKRGAFLGGDLFTPCDQTWTTSAGDYRIVKLGDA